MSAEIDWFKTLAPLVFPSAVIERALEQESIADLDWEVACESFLCAHKPTHEAHFDLHKPCGCEHFICREGLAQQRSLEASDPSRLWTCPRCTALHHGVGTAIPISAAS